jgi:V-type H+-transporting ATPase proteolipid subunit
MEKGQLATLYPGGQYFFGYLGIAFAMVFSNLGSAVGISKAGIGISSMGVLKPEKIVRSIIPVVMAGILGIYGLVVSVLLIQNTSFTDEYTYQKGFKFFASGLCCGLCSLAAGFTIGIVGDSSVRALGITDKFFVGMLLMLIFAEAIALFGLIIALMMLS